jgi:hypothetical protein
MGTNCTHCQSRGSIPLSADPVPQGMIDLICNNQFSALWRRNLVTNAWKLKEKKDKSVNPTVRLTESWVTKRDHESQVTFSCPLTVNEVEGGGTIEKVLFS